MIWQMKLRKISHHVGQELENFFSEDLDGEYVQFFKSFGLCHNHPFGLFNMNAMGIAMFQ